MSEVDQKVLPNIIWQYLPDSTRKMNQTPVYMETQLTPEIWDAGAALRYVRDNLPSPLLLRKISADGMTVVLEASKNPRILIGRAPPTLDANKDIQEILDVLGSHGIQGEIHG